MPSLDPYKGDYYLWHYLPSLWAAIAFAILFSPLTALHAWKMWRTRLWFCSPFVIGGVLEILGYITRIAARYSTSSLSLYVLQSAFLLLAPILFAASLYMVYSRVVRALHAESLSLITPRWTTILFVGGDWLCLNVQGAGAGLLAKPKNAKIGEHIVVAGLSVQIVVFLGFVLVCSHFHVRYRRNERERRKGIGTTGAMSSAYTSHTGLDVDAVPWQAILNMLYATSLLILVRNVFRIVEFVMGQDSYLFENEWPVYVFDGVLMALVMGAFWWWFPGGLRVGGGGTGGHQRVQSEDLVELRGRENDREGSR